MTRAPAGGEPGFWSKTARLVRKDLVVERRARETLVPMAVFALAVTLLLAFTLGGTGGAENAAPGAVDRTAVVAGFFWITVLFAGLIGFARTFEIEREDAAIEPLLLAPLDRSGLFVAKAAANLAYVVLVQGALLPTFAVLFDLRTHGRGLALVLVVALVDVGFVALETLFAAVAAQTRNREIILPILSLPALVPVFVAGVELSSDVLNGAGLDAIAAAGWFGILIAFDLVAIVVGVLAMDFVLE